MDETQRETIKITKFTQIEYVDLMKVVDFSSEFTLRDVLRACINSKISPEILSNILHCGYIEEYWEEAKSKPFEGIPNAVHLNIYLMATKDVFEGKRCDEQVWFINAVGGRGYMSEDIASFKDFTKEEIENYREEYAIEYSPLYKLADFPIKIENRIDYSDYIDHKYLFLDHQPRITLIEMLYAIFTELSVLGDIAQRDKFTKEMAKDLEINNIDFPKNAKLYSTEEVFERVNKKISDIRNRRNENGM